MPYTIRAASRELHVSPTTIVNWLQEGKLFEVPVKGGVRLVSDESVERIKRETAQAKAGAS